MRTLKLLSFTLFLSCSTADKKQTLSDTNLTDKALITPKQIDNKAYFLNLNKLFVIGNFDEDDAQDTLYQHNFSKLSKTEIDSAPNPFQNDWGIVVKWFYDHQADVYLAFNKPNKDTLHLGIGQGLYCLLNVGDNNMDGKDEIALVIDYCDFSQVNSCNIYSFCNGKWSELKQFGIHEDAFAFSSNLKPIFTDIKKILAKQNGKWVYSDYRQGRQIDQAKMKTLTVNNCK